MHFIFGNLGIIIPTHEEELVRKKKEEGKKAALVVFGPPTFSTGLVGEKKKRKIRGKGE